MHTFLQKMYLERILQQGEVDAFEKTLQPHQTKMLAESGVPVLRHAVIQHNLLAASRVYNNITFGELGRLLGISGKEAERVASRMISQKRLAGQIDQIDGLIIFDTAHDPLATWDRQIEHVCYMANAIIEANALRS